MNVSPPDSPHESASSSPVSAPSATPSARVVVFTREPCHLCAQALEIVARSCGDLGVSWAVTDIDASPDLRAAYGDYVPVVVVDGVQQGFWRIDEARLRRILASDSPGTANSDAPGTDDENA
jgi:Glutaredoxin-like domain (DUF836)